MKALKVFIASALGAGIGSLVALQLAGFWWWVGLIAGAIIGFLSYEYQEVWSAVKKSWTSTISWRPNALHLKFRFVGFALLAIVVGLNGFLLLWSLILITDHNYIFNGYVVFFSALSVMLFSGLLGFIACDSDHMTEEDIQNNITTFKMFIKMGNPIPIIFRWIPKLIYIILKELYHLISAGIKLIPKIPAATVIFLKFIATIFIFLYSDIRLLCAINAAIGTFVGYLYSNVLFGTSVGGVFGVLGYYIPPLLSQKFVHSHE